MGKPYVKLLESPDGMARVYRFDSEIRPTDFFGDDARPTRDVMVSDAVTDEQFAIAVHDGEAWQRVRECRNIGCETGDDFKCSACGEAYNESDDMAMPASRIDWCFSCGAKVVG